MSLTLLDADDPALAPRTRVVDAVTAVGDARIDPAAEVHRRTIVDFVDRHPDALWRTCTAGHLTGSALVVDPRGEAVVLLHHRKLRRWLQPGGHCDGEASLAAVALREAAEETGLAGLRIHPTAIDLDVHRVEPPSEGPHLHLDVRFLVVSATTAPPPGNVESTAIRWVPVDELGAVDLDPGTHRMIRRGLELLRTAGDGPAVR